MPDLPFYANPDSMHCAVAVFKSLVEYYFDENLSWAEAEKLQGFHGGYPGWNVIPQTKLARRGVKIRCIEPFDYVRYQKIGDDYFKELYSPEVATWYLDHSTIRDTVPYIAEFEQKVDHQKRRATIKDVTDMLAGGFLVAAEINSRQLNDKDGFSSHYILIHNYDGHDFLVNDPGPPAQQNRKIAYKKMQEAIEAPGQNNEVTGYYYAAAQ